MRQERLVDYRRGTIWPLRDGCRNGCRAGRNRCLCALPSIASSPLPSPSCGDGREPARGSSASGYVVQGLCRASRRCRIIPSIRSRRPVLSARFAIRSRHCARCAAHSSRMAGCSLSSMGSHPSREFRLAELAHAVLAAACGGCHLNRKMDDLIRAGGFRIDDIRTGYMKGPKPMTFMYQGCATP